jgi:spoIIIJ-associated protein
MMKSIEGTGRTEEEAIASALRKLGLERDEVSVEILELAKTGFLGLGASPAKVRINYEAPDAVRKEHSDIYPVS